MTISMKRMTRLGALVGALVGAISLLGSCGQHDANTDATTNDAGSIVLYSSQDDYVLAQAVAAFEADTGISVRVVGDTEATKTTGLVNRLLAEHERGVSGGASGGADVWWSNEPFGTIRLSEAGVLEAYTSEIAERAFDPREFDQGWPGTLVSEDGNWYGHALRARVIVYSTDRVSQPPTTVQELVEPEWNGRIGIARPQFGTTRGHMAAMLEAFGTEGFERWLAALKANGVRVYDSNSSVVRAVWMGEIDAGLTDTDDVMVGQGRGWSVGMQALEGGDRKGGLLVPCTVGLVVGGANPEGGKAFIDWVLSGAGERVLYESESKNTPIHPEAKSQIREDDAPAVFLIDFWASEPDLGSGYYEWIASRVPEAMAICERTGL